MNYVIIIPLNNLTCTIFGFIKWKLIPATLTLFNYHHGTGPWTARGARARIHRKIPKQENPKDKKLLLRNSKK